MQSSDVSDAYRNLQCNSLVFPDFFRLIRKVDRLRELGVLKSGEQPGITAAKTIGDILDMDAEEFRSLPTIGGTYSRQLRLLQQHILEDTDSLIRLAKDSLKEPTNSGLAAIPKNLPFALSELSLNYQFINSVEEKTLAKIARLGIDYSVESIIISSSSSISRLPSFGAGSITAFESIKNKISEELHAIEQDENPLETCRNSILRVSTYRDLDLHSLDQCLVDDIESYLFSLDAMDQDIALARWGFHQKKEVLEEIGARYGVTRERIRQIARGIDNELPNIIRIDPNVLKQNIRENLTSSLTKVLPSLAACFDSKRLFYSFIEILCHAKKNSIFSIAHPVVKSRMLDIFFCENASPIPKDRLIEELTSNFGFGYTLAQNTIKELQRAKRLRITDSGIYPLNLGKNEAIAHTVAAYPNGLPWKDLARIVNKSGCCSTKISEDRLYEQGFSQNMYIYLCGRGVYRNLKFLNVSQRDVQNMIENIRQYLVTNNASSIHLVDYYYQADQVTKLTDYYDLRHIVRMFGEDFGLFFRGRSGVDAIGITPNFERITQSKLIVEIMAKSKRAMNVSEIASRLKSKSTIHAGTYLDQLMQSGAVVRVDNLMYTTPEKAFRNIDKDLILCMIDDILLDSGRPVECDVFRLKINREFGLSFPKYFYASLAYLNMDEFGWYRSGNLFATERLGFTSMRAYVKEHCHRDAARVENLEMLKRVVDVTEQAGLAAIDSWKQSTIGLA